MPGILTIATCQHAIDADTNTNLSSILKQMNVARGSGAEIAHFPECNLSGYAGEEFPKIDPKKDAILQKALDKICEQAGSLGIWVILGSHHFEKDKSKPFNSLYIISDTGMIHDRYDKRLLTGIQGDMEHRHYTPGKQPVVFSINGVVCGLLICHEWRYPELYREYYRMKVKLLFQSWYDGNLSPDRYRREGKELGELITGTVRGNAASNYLWISASNNSSKESSFPSFVAQPDGRIMHKLSRNRAGVLISRIDTEEVFTDPSSHNRKRLLNM
jgi:deaminated glutathione amidase